MPKYFDLEISLDGIKPRIWRRFLLAHTATFEALHEAIQDALGWDGGHLFEFRDGRQAIARADFDDPDADEVPTVGRLKLAAFFTKKGQRCLYVYDFGDNWEHVVELVGVIALPEKFKRRLVAGARACPPEDCGGVWGYEECVLVATKPDRELANRKGGDLLERKEWLGDWMPEAFDLNAVKKDFDD